MVAEDESGREPLTDDALAAAIIEASPDAFIVLDEAGIVRFASRGMRRFKEVPDDLVGRSAVDIVDPEWVDEVAINLEEAFSGKIPGGRIAASELHLADGTSVLAELMVHRPEDPRVGALVVQVHAVPEVRPLDDFLAAMVDARGLDDLLQPVLLLAQTNAPAEGCSIHWDWTGKKFDERTSAGVDAELLEAGRFATDEVPWRQAALRGETVVLPELAAIDTPFALEAARLGFGSVWSIPVTVPGPGSDLAVLSVWRARRGALTSSNRLSVDRALQMTALAIERHRTGEQLRHAALHDPLTGAPNRTLLQRHLEAPPDEAERIDAVLVLDLDGFKEINDRYGHPAGDLVLRTVVDRLDAALRPGDLLARLGGDEFAVVCRAVSDETEAAAIARRLLDELTQPLEIEGRTLRIGASIGISLGAPGVTGDQLLRAADEGLIAAKRSGKGTFEFSPEPGTR